MSYCRWSSDWGECDIYCYADCMGGWTTHVAGRRVKHSIPQHIRELIPPTMEDGDAWVKGYQAFRKAKMEWQKQFPHEVIHDVDGDEATVFFADSEYLDLSEIGEEAGESYNDDTPGECADRLELLKQKGFNVPQYAIDSLREEQEEEDYD